MKTIQGEEKSAIQTAAQVCVNSYQKLAAQVEQAKQNLLADFRKTLGVPERLCRLALNEAEALAWQTEFPHLLFPTLAMEKIQAVAGWSAKQHWLRVKNSAAAVAI